MTVTLIGASALLQQAVAVADRVAVSRLPVLLVGETGTGKEVFAQYIHARSGRHGRPIDLNCAGLPREIVDGLLFGHRRGAFTGAVEDAPGLIAQAHRGTLFLDELASLPLESQAKLLRVLETREYRRLGDVEKRTVDFRLIAAVQEDFSHRVWAGEFRHDLYHRVAGLRIELPPLRARRDDIGPLAAHFAAEHRCAVGDDALPLLRRHGWPGNVRELRMVIDRAAVLSDDRVLRAAVIAQALAGQEARMSDWARERAWLLELCAASEWDPVRLRQALGKSRATMYRKLGAHGIRLSQGRQSQVS